ncbi:MAG: PKD domain-containing protein, partial [Ktedonobacterales bacterium]
IELGIARALATYWKSHHLAPARTLRFVIFDAEEQGLYGSWHYINQSANGDLPNVVVMFNEEQSGIAYPLRYLGQASSPLMPLYVYTAPLNDNDVYSGRAQLSRAQRTAITTFAATQRQARSPVFARFQALGDGQALYHGAGGKDTPLPIFGQGDLANIQQSDDDIGSSDQLPFTVAGVPCVTYVGNATYYDTHPPLGSYPYDQPEDTIQLMNTFANGTSSEAPTLELSLALPGMLTTWSLSQPGVLGFAAPDGKPVATIGDIGQTVAGQSLTFTGQTATPGGALQFAWDFGDGARADGASVIHTYAQPGAYTLTLTVNAAGQSRVITHRLAVTAQPATFPNPYAGQLLSGSPPSNPTAILPTPNP